MEKIGIASAIDLINTSFPPAKRIFSSQPLTFAQTLSLRNLKVPYFDVPFTEAIGNNEE
jgi:hypothetical protein